MEPDSAVSAFEASETENSAVRLCDCDLSCLQLAVLDAVIASYLQSGSREWHPSGRPRRTYNLLNIYMSGEGLSQTEDKAS